MDSNQYLKEAAVTLSHDWHVKVSKEHFLDCLTMCIGHLKQLDRIKKSIFYGKDFLFTYDKDEPMLEANSKEVEYIAHGIIGIATEAGELLEALHANILLGKGFDEVNIKEEQGDSLWYQAILCRFLDTTFDEIMEININKLRTRYPNKFNAFDANNRDLDKEREVLESKPRIETGILSKRGFAWVLFAEEVLKHVNNYTVPQYGDAGEDQVTNYSVEDCIKQALKYLNRHGKNAREGQEKLDMLKAAHYIQLACEKMQEGSLNLSSIGY